MLPSMPSLTPVKSEEIKNDKTFNSPENLVLPMLEKSQAKEEVKELGKVSVKLYNYEHPDNGDEIIEFKKSKIKATRTSLAKQNESRDLQESKITKEMLSMETDSNDDINYANAYYERIKDRLNPEMVKTFRELLLSINSGEDPSEIYKKLEPVLLPEHPDLLDQFLSFLTPKQAIKIGKFMEYFLVTNMDKFVQMCQIYFLKQPGQMRKLYTALSDLSNSSDVSMEKIKSSILPFIKGNAMLTEWFLQLFPSEKPQQSELIDFERLDFDKIDNSDMFENIVIPEENDDRYGGDNCICNCHESEEIKYKTRYLHCIPCGVKYIQGRVYVQYGKRVRPATITFEGSTPMADHIKRLSAKPKVIKRRADNSPTKLFLSPNKNCHSDDHRSEQSTDTDEYVKKTPKKGVRNLQNKCRNKPLQSATKGTHVTFKDSLPAKDKESQSPKSPTKLPDPVVLMCSNNNQDLIIEPVEREVNVESIDPKLESVSNSAVQVLINTDDLNVSIESDDKMSSVSIESSDTSSFSDSDVSVHSEKSDIINSDSEPIDTEENTNDSAEANKKCILNISSEDNQNIKISPDTSKSTSFVETIKVESDGTLWTREEDKIVLQTFQVESDFDSTVDKICELLPHKNVTEIKNRFRVLLNLLQKISSQE